MNRLDRRLILLSLWELKEFIPLQRRSYKTMKKVYGLISFVEKEGCLYKLEKIPTASKKFPMNGCRVGRVLNDRKKILSIMKMKHSRFFELLDIVMRVGIIDENGNITPSFLKRLRAVKKQQKIKSDFRFYFKTQDINNVCTKIQSSVFEPLLFRMRDFKNKRPKIPPGLAEGLRHGNSTVIEKKLANGISLDEIKQEQRRQITGKLSKMIPSQKTNWRLNPYRGNKIKEFHEFLRRK